MGGQIGGLKYVVHDVLVFFLSFFFVFVSSSCDLSSMELSLQFKFATSSKKTISSDEMFMKIASHEVLLFLQHFSPLPPFSQNPKKKLKSLDRMIGKGVDGVHFPLMCLIDFKG